MPKAAKKKAPKKATAPSYSVSGIPCPITGEDIRFVELAGGKFMATTSLWTSTIFSSKKELADALTAKVLKV